MFLLVCLASHGVLDAMTDGGKGIGFFIPFDNHRYFLPFRPIHVSPIGLNLAGDVLWSELKWIWIPAGLIALAGKLLGHTLRRYESTRRDAQGSPNDQSE